MKFQNNLNAIWLIESNAHAHVLLNLLNLLQKMIKRCASLAFYHFSPIRLIN